MIGTRFGVRAVDLIKQGKFNHLVCAQGIEISDVPFEVFFFFFFFFGVSINLIFSAENYIWPKVCGSSIRHCHDCQVREGKKGGKEERKA